MPTLGTKYLSSVLGAAEAPCVSIYLPTHRSYPDNQQDGIRFKHLVRSAEDALCKAYPGRDVRQTVERLRSLQEDANFWATNPAEGVAVLASPVRFDVLKLPRPVAERVEVGETFHVKPLIRYIQSADRFQVLGVSRERVAVFDGNRYEMHPLDVPGLPLTMEEALGSEVDERVRRFHTGGGPASAVYGGRGAHGVAISHGQDSRKEEILPDVHRFFRAVDREVLDRVSDPTGLPLIPAGTDDNLAEFRAVSKNRFVAADGIHGDWTHWTLPEIRDRAWKVLEKHYLDRLARIREDYGTAAARKLATGDLIEAAKAAAEGRVGTMLIDADKTLPGSIDLANGNLRPAGPADTHPGDMLDDLAELGLRHGSTVTVVPADQMPTKTGLAAIFRF